MRIKIDESRCQGHARCNVFAPTVVLLRDDDGHAVVVDVQVSRGDEEAARRAHAACPEQAIELVDD